MAKGGGPHGGLYACGRPEGQGAAGDGAGGPSAHEVNLEMRTLRRSGEVRQPNRSELRLVVDWVTVRYVNVNVYFVVTQPS